MEPQRQWHASLGSKEVSLSEIPIRNNCNAVSSGRNKNFGKATGGGDGHARFFTNLTDTLGQTPLIEQDLPLNSCSEACLVGMQLPMPRQLLDGWPAD